jgi:hypothetical protein
MKGKDAEKRRPQLARASDPFTPLTRKAVPEGTPYHALRVDDLATPKLNKSHSGSDHTEIEMSMGSDDTGPGDQIQELRQALLSAMAVIDRLEKSRKPVQYRTVSTQTTEISDKRERHERIPSKEPRPHHDPKLKPISSADRNRFPLISGSPVCSSSSDSRDKALELGRQRAIDRMAAICNRFERKLDIQESQ